MRKIQNLYNKENRYDQITNLTVDLQDQLNKSVILPKISQRHHEQQLKDYISRRKMQGDLAISHLQSEVDKLRRQIINLEDKRYLSQKLRTEENELVDDRDHWGRSRHMISHHYAQTEECRLSEHQPSSRLQRNTDSRPILARPRESQPKQETLSQANLSSSKVVRLSKEKQSSKHFFQSNIKPVIEKQKIKKKKNSNPLLRRKFRKCVIAVYFSILIPSLARRIYKNKLKLFINEYPHEISKYYLNKKDDKVSRFKYDEAKLWSLLSQKMNLMEAVEQANLASCLKDASEQREIRVHFQFLINEELSSNDREVKDHLTYQEQLMFPKNVAFLLGKLVDISTQMFDSFTELLRSNSFFKTQWKTLAQNILNSSFVNNSRPKLLNRVIESGLVKMHPTKEIISVASEQAQIALLTFDIFCRIYCYRWLCKLQKDKLTKQYSQQNATIGNFLCTFLYLVGETLLDETIKVAVKTNRSLPEKNKSLNRKIRAILPLSVKKKYKGLSTDVRRLIIDPPYFEEASSFVLEYSDVVDKIKNKMANAGRQLYYVLKDEMKADAKEIKENTIKQMHILKQDKDRLQNLLVYELQDSNHNNQSERVHVNTQRNGSQVDYISKSTISIMIKKPKMHNY